MASDFVQFAVAVIALTVGAAAEELFPKFLGVGMPVLLMASQFFASRRGALAMAVFAIAAGAAEDALCMLPMMTSVSYFLLSAAVSRISGHPREIALLAFPGYQFWLYLWVSDISGGIFLRLLVSLPVGFAVALAVWAALTYLEMKAAVDAEG